MSNVREQRIYCAEQIYVPENLPIIIKHYSKEVIRNNPGNPTPEELYEFSMKYFGDLLKKRNKDDEDKSEIKKPDSTQIREPASK